MDRRTFLKIAGATPLALAAPVLVSAQDDDSKPDFTPAGSQQTDPAGYEIAWTEDWELREGLSTFEAKTEPGRRGFIVLDADSTPGFPDSPNRRTILETVSDPAATDAEAYIAAIPDDRPEQQGYAPGTYVHSRHVTERGGWICHAADVDDPSRAFRGLELFYLPQSPGDPVLIVSGIDFNPGKEGYTADGLAAIDSSISVNGDWLLAMDDLDSYWQALEAVSEGSSS